MSLARRRAAWNDSPPVSTSVVAARKREGKRQATMLEERHHEPSKVAEAISDVLRRPRPPRRPATSFVRWLADHQTPSLQ
jgi:hypothetical protein